MSFFKAMDISSSGLTAQRTRMNLLSSNLANVNTTRTPEGGPYKRQDAVFSSVPAESFQAMLDNSYGTELQKVQVTDIHQDQRAPRRVFDPSHPDADKEGYVAMPNIQVMSEMVNMITATRSFEANTTALNQAKEMAVKSLDIGR